MAVSKQHFEMFARIIRVAREHGAWDENPDGLRDLINHVCVECEAANPRFDRVRFSKACEEQVDRRTGLDIKPRLDTIIDMAATWVDDE